VALLAAPAVTGAPSLTAPLDEATADVVRLGRALFTDYVFAFEVTAVLLTIAVVGAVVLVRRARTEATAGAGEGRS
jgi:NADH-quinone oxidoreductase subunit J